MSRVDEALRRAAERAGADAGATHVRPETETVPELEPEALAREPFPLEMPERRHSHKSGPTVVAAPVHPTPVVAPKHHPAQTTAAKPASLFERMPGNLSEKVVIDAKIQPASREQYRRLAATLHHAQAANGLKVVMIASALQGEGKTLTATNLALTLSESYQRSVLLIDADLRRPTLHTVFNVDNSAGLTDGLVAKDHDRLPVRQVSPRLAILPAGRPSSDPMAGLTSDRMARVIDEAREAFDWVIVDTPPVVLLTDASLLGAMVDGAVLVIKAGSTPYDLVNRAVDSIGRDRILGVVLNRAVEAAHDSYGYYNYYYGGPPEAAPRG
jgi:protein-tyrosine kinase